MTWCSCFFPCLTSYQKAGRVKVTHPRASLDERYYHKDGFSVDRAPSRISCEHLSFLVLAPAFQLRMLRITGLVQEGIEPGLQLGVGDLAVCSTDGLKPEVGHRAVVDTTNHHLPRILFVLSTTHH